MWLCLVSSYLLSSPICTCLVLHLCLPGVAGRCVLCVIYSACCVLRWEVGAGCCMCCMWRWRALGLARPCGHGRRGFLSFLLWLACGRCSAHCTALVYFAASPLCGAASHKRQKTTAIPLGQRCRLCLRTLSRSPGLAGWWLVGRSPRTDFAHATAGEVGGICWHN
jgi:hypothetical protein